MSDIQSRIAVWQIKTFGEPEDAVYRSLLKLREEHDELEDNLCIEEVADMGVVLFALAARMGFDLLEAVEKKFSIVESRTDQVERDIARGIR